jgi:hypothetical protein
VGHPSKVIDITRPEPLLIDVKQNEFATVSQEDRKLWIVSLISNKSLSPIRGTISCEYPFSLLGAPVITGESATLATGSGMLSDRSVRLGILTPALNPHSPLMMAVLAPDTPGLGSCTFKRD